MTKKQIHLELESLMELAYDGKTTANTPDIKTALCDLRVLVGYILYDRDMLKKELDFLRKSHE